MAKLELSIWNVNHEKELISNFKFNKKTIKERKSELKSLTAI